VRLNLPTLAELQQTRRAPQRPTRKLVEKTAKAKDDKAQLEAWRRKVRDRDEMKCRVCQRKVIVTLELVANRAECHHIVGRAFKALRYDRRNGLLVCLDPCHRKLTTHDLVIVGQAKDMFEIEPGGRRYLNADRDLQFVRQGK
jgi:hypothetical protein